MKAYNSEVRVIDHVEKEHIAIRAQNHKLVTVLYIQGYINENISIRLHEHSEHHARVKGF